MTVRKLADGSLIIGSEGAGLGVRSPVEAGWVLDRLELGAGHLDLQLDLGEARARLDQCGRLSRQRRQLGDATADGLAQRLAEGADLATVAGEAAIAAMLSDPDSPLAAAVDAVERQRLRDALDTARRAVAPEKAFRHTQGLVGEVVGEVRSLRPTLRGVTSGQQALQAGVETSTAWARYEAALTRWWFAHELVRMLRGLGWVPRLPTGTPRGASQYARFDRLDDARGRLELLDPLYDSLEPGLFTSAEVAQHVAQVEAEQRENAQREAREAREAMGAGRG